MGIKMPSFLGNSFLGNLPSNSLAGRADAGQDMSSISHINGPVYTIDTSSTVGATIVTSSSGPYYTTDVYNKKRIDLKKGGKIPVDIWAQLYNNGVIDD